MIARTWNLFHGNTVPPGRHAYLRQMVELITADRPDIVCLQEIPAWALGLVGTWANMQAVTVRARRSTLGPFPLPASVGRALTAPHHGLIRSAFAGQGNAILIPREAKIREQKTATLNTNVFCEERGARLGLTRKQMRGWERERRSAHLVKYELPDRRRFLVANFHATSSPNDPRLPDAEVARAAGFAERASEVPEVQLLAGDFNLTHEQSQSVKALVAATLEERWAAAGPGIDQMLLRGAAIKSSRVWPEDERRANGRLLSDHAPVEIEF